MQKIVFVTGAGISVGSGLPTYRGQNGLYDDRVVEDGYKIHEIMSRKIADSKPDLFNKYYDLIKKSIDESEPNEVHKAISSLEKNGFDVFVYTQNIDDLHEKAGSKNCVHLHGGGSENEPLVLFGDNLNIHKLFAMSKDINSADLVVIIGTSVSFEYIKTPVISAAKKGIKVVTLDPDPLHPFSKIGLQIKDPSSYSFFLLNIKDFMIRA